MTKSDPISDEHYTAFGKIIQVVAQIDGLLDQIIIAIVRGQPPILPLLTLLGNKDKMDYILAMTTVSTLSPITRDGLEKLIGRVRNIQGLRNQIAHSSWRQGKRAGAIKPLTMSARSTLKMLGTGHNEKEWTVKELNLEVERYKQLGTDLAAFMKTYGLLRMWRKRSGKNPRKSQSKGG
jgi:hypothetical protein